MKSLLDIVKQVNASEQELPFSVYSSIKEQNLLNVPIAKPLLIVVLSGDKVLGQENKITCQAGDFIFLSDSPAVNMRNIPKNKAYYALLIDFDYEDIKGLESSISSKKNYLVGKTTMLLEQCLQQFVESALWAPTAIISLRKREIIELLIHLGHQDISSLLGTPMLKNRLHELFLLKGFTGLTTTIICDQLALSESTLRRKLKREGTSIQQIKDLARLGLGVHLLQTTEQPIGLISDACGYQSQSRFTERFKHRFGLTPTELRLTKMAD
jgi:AraC-like DNA-binding protein